jgi:hypothetical protein
MKMKTLKKLLIIFLISLISFSFLYLAISFTYADFNFMNWSEEVRFRAVLGSVALMMIKILLL